MSEDSVVLSIVLPHGALHPEAGLWLRRRLIQRMWSMAGERGVALLDVWTTSAAEPELLIRFPGLFDAAKWKMLWLGWNEDGLLHSVQTFRPIARSKGGGFRTIKEFHLDHEAAEAARAAYPAEERATIMTFPLAVGEWETEED